MKPLEGIRVVDFTQAYSGPFCTMQLADYGAEVIKVERYGSGDQSREWAPIKNGNSGFYATFNRGKKSLEINLRSKEGKEVIEKLYSECDVVVENFKVGSLDRLGLGYEKMKEINPQIIYASISGFGTTGPLSNLPAYDNVISAVSGIMDLTGEKDGTPTKIGPSIGDNYTGLNLVLGITMALYNRIKTGEGQRLDVAMMDSLFTLMDAGILKHENTNEKAVRKGLNDGYFAPYGVYRAEDGFVTLAITKDSEWKMFCRAINNEDLALRYPNNKSRLENYEVSIEPILKKYFSELKKEEISHYLLELGVSAFPVNNIPEIIWKEYIISQDMAVDLVDSGVGKMKTYGLPMKFSKTKGGIEKSAPLLGENTLEILNHLNYTEEEIQEMVNNRIVNII
jgi:CoA:oxalate CoA-transferase